MNDDILTWTTTVGHR